MKNSFYKNKRVLVTGGTGMIGIPLVKKLLNLKAKVKVVSLDDKKRCPKEAKFIRLDLTKFENCIKITKNIDIVFHLAGIKGSPKMAITRPASFLYPTVSFSFNMLEASRINKVKNYLFTSSVGVYSPSKIFYEDSVWSTFPSKNDWYAGWAKRICELQVDAYRKEFGFQNLSIIRPANVYGPYDNFDTENAMVIPSLIKKAIESKKKYLEVLGDGTPIRDFVFSEDVADAMLEMVKKKINIPLNIGSGKGYSIKKLAETIASNVPNKKIKWKKVAFQGDKIRILSMKKANSKGIKAKTSIQVGIKKTIEWYLNKKDISNRYNIFK
jgi:GDP-L-fucose synthase